MKGKVIRTDAGLQNCIYFQQRVDIWICGEFEEEVIMQTMMIQSMKL